MTASHTRLPEILTKYEGELLAEWLRPLLGEHFNLYLLLLVLATLTAGVVLSLINERRKTGR